MQDIVIIGAGGIGKEAAWIIEQINEERPTFKILGFVDDDNGLKHTIVNGYEVLGNVDWLLNSYENVCVVCAISSYEIKKSILEKLNLKKFDYPAIISPGVYIHNSNILGKGCIIYPGVIITTNIKLGDYVIICPKCGIGHEVIIDSYCSILWNVSVSGKVIIEEGCLIGSGTTIIQDRIIGREAILGAGSVVIKDIPSNSTAVGCPAKVVS